MWPLHWLQVPLRLYVNCPLTHLQHIFVRCWSPATANSALIESSSGAIMDGSWAVLHLFAQAFAASPVWPCLHHLSGFRNLIWMWPLHWLQVPLRLYVNCPLTHLQHIFVRWLSSATANSALSESRAGPTFESDFEGHSSRSPPIIDGSWVALHLLAQTFAASPVVGALQATSGCKNFSSMWPLHLLQVPLALYVYWPSQHSQHIFLNLLSPATANSVSTESRAGHAGRSSAIRDGISAFLHLVAQSLAASPVWGALQVLSGFKNLCSTWPLHLLQVPLALYVYCPSQHSQHIFLNSLSPATANSVSTESRTEPTFDSNAGHAGRGGDSRIRDGISAFLHFIAQAFAASPELGSLQLLSSFKNLCLMWPLHRLQVPLRLYVYFPLQHSQHIFFNFLSSATATSAPVGASLTAFSSNHEGGRAFEVLTVWA